jgi:hypothetical protein
MDGFAEPNTAHSTAVSLRWLAKTGLLGSLERGNSSSDRRIFGSRDPRADLEPEERHDLGQFGLNALYGHTKGGFMSYHFDAYAYRPD